VSEALFSVREISNRMVIVWQLQMLVDLLKDDDAKVDAGGLAGYMYTVEQFNAFYGFTAAMGQDAPREAKAELRCYGQVCGEYKNRLYWDGRGHLFRTFHSGTHYLTQHGLDGFPLILYNHLLMHKPDVPIFRIVHRHGFSDLSLDRWTRYFASGRNEHSLADLVNAQLRMPLF